MDPKLYLKKHYVMTYMEDAVAQLLSRKTPAKTHPLTFLLEYFKAVRNGSHIISREYSYISSTPHNRASFIKLLWKSYFGLSKEGMVMKVADYFPLLQLLCEDFPLNEWVQLVQSLLTGDGHQVAADGSAATSFADFLYAFQVVFYFEAFLLECEKVYRSLLMGVQLDGFQTVMGVVVVPHSDTTPPDEEIPIKTTSEQSQGESPVEGRSTPAAATSPLISFSLLINSQSTVSTPVFTQSLEKLCDRMAERQPWLACPSAATIRGLLADSLPDISLHNFLVKMIHSQGINSMIGVLPKKEDYWSSPPPSLTS